MDSHILAKVWPSSYCICPWLKLERMKCSAVRRPRCYLPSYKRCRCDASMTDCWRYWPLGTWHCWWQRASSHGCNKGIIRRFRLLVIRMTSHLSGLKCINQSDSHCFTLLKSVWSCLEPASDWNIFYFHNDEMGSGISYTPLFVPSPSLCRFAFAQQSVVRKQSDFWGDSGWKVIYRSQEET